MATYVIDKNEARVPFFGDRMSFITGLDPLGLQNTSNKVYTHLLTGLNNVTSHIRNYSFYCWLLHQYAKIISTSNPKDQQIFIRRAEYIIALLSYSAEILGINGRQYAQKRFEENLTEFDLQKGTYNENGSTPGTYWQNPWGIFGQYYIGSLKQIGLVDEPVNEKGVPLGIFRITSKIEGLKISGKDLAEAFEKNISVQSKNKFLEAIAAGVVSLKDLEDLVDDLNLKKIPGKSNERDLLIELLLDVNEPLLLVEKPSTSRRETMIHVLKFLHENTFAEFEQHEFTMYAYKVRGKISDENDDTLTGWYLYQFNEYWQVALTGIFNGSLAWLEKEVGPNWMTLNEFIHKCSLATTEYLEQNDLVNVNDTIRTTISNLEKYSERELYHLILRSSKEERMAYSFLLVLKLYPVNNSFLQFLRTYSDKEGIDNSQDPLEVVNYYLRFESHLEDSLEDFIIGFLRTNIIQRHQYVAYRKMGSGSQSTQKFIIEDGFIRVIGNFGPGFTSPRIVSLLEFMYDLSLIDKEFKLTSRGEHLLMTFQDD